MSKAFASQADLDDKKITFEQLSTHCWAYTAEGDPNSGVIIGDRFIMVSDATATPANDGAETLAIKRALGDSAKKLSITASKSQFGHTLGAAGAIGAAVAVFCLRDQVVSPTLRLIDPDPECDLDYTPLVARERRLRAALVNAFAFGGNNVCLALRRWEGR